MQSSLLVSSLALTGGDPTKTASVSLDDAEADLRSSGRHLGDIDDSNAPVGLVRQLMEIGPSTRINFLRLSHSGGASGLLAIGTAEQPIAFTGADALDPGAWAGIRIQDNAIDGKTRFEHVEIRSGGGFNSDANVTLYGASPTFINTRIVDSDCWGIWADNYSTPSLSGVVFENNGCGDVGP